MTHLLSRGRTGLATAAALLALMTALTACSGDDDPKAGDPVSTQSPTPTPTSGSTDQGDGKGDGKGDPDDPATTETADPVPDPVVGDYTPVKRDGKVPKPTVTAPPASFDDKVQYDDGVSLDITDVEQGKVEGKGPGVLVGTPQTSISMTMTNKSGKTVSLNGVVVTMLYGADGRQARPVYDDHTARDFTGKLAPGKSVDAVYLFSVPRSELDELTMYVDFDGVHTVGKFTGSLQ